MIEPVRALGIDFGERRIGLAISDPDGRLALPLETVQRDTDRRAIARIAAIARREGAERLVAGEPLGPEGVKGTAAARAARFAHRLAEKLGLPLELVDESLTSVAAEERLREAGIDPRSDRGRVDQVAAQILLQESLDRQGDA